MTFVCPLGGTSEVPKEDVLQGEKNVLDTEQGHILQVHEEFEILDEDP